MTALTKVTVTEGGAHPSGVIGDESRPSQDAEATSVALPTITALDASLPVKSQNTSHSVAVVAA